MLIIYVQFYSFKKLLRLNGNYNPLFACGYLVWFGLVWCSFGLFSVWFYDISTIVNYLFILIIYFYTYEKLYFNQFRLK